MPTFTTRKTVTGLFTNIQTNLRVPYKGESWLKEHAVRPPRKTDQEKVKGRARAMAKRSDWIAEATSKNKGAFSAKASKAGMSTQAYADKVTAPGSKASTKTKKQGQLAKTLSKMRKK